MAAAAAAAEESMSVAALAVSVPDSTGGSPEAGGGVGAAGEEKDAAPQGTEVVGDSEEDGDDVFEVEKILDMKCEGVCGGCAARTGPPGRGGDGGGESERGTAQPSGGVRVRARWSRRTGRAGAE